jgi:hypothetical protein
MNKQNVTGLVKTIQTAVTKHSPEILTGIGIAGMVTTTIFAVKATPTALDLIARAEDEKFDNGHGEHLTKIEVIKVAWKPYIPAAVTCTVSIACLIGASSVNFRRNAALATAYKLSEAALTEYKDAVVETIGEKKEQVVKEKISKNRVEQNPVSNNTIYITGNGDTLFLEPISKRYFYSDIEQVRSIINTLNESMYNDPFGHIPLSDFYDAVGLEQTDISNDIGWNIEHGSIKVEFHPAMSDKGKPCLALYYETAPNWGYDR